MDKCILVEDVSTAGALRDYLVSSDPLFQTIKVFDRDGIEKNDTSGVRYIFSSWNMPILNEMQVAKEFPSLRAVFYAAGDSSYFSEAYVRNGIQVYSAQKENARPVAEFVLGQVLLANKGYFQAQAQYRKGFWRFGFNRARSVSLEKASNKGSKIGIIGFGAIGSRLVSLLKQFELEVLVHDKYVDEKDVTLYGATSVSLNDIFRDCDIISNHLPDHPSTVGLLNYKLFSMMKPHATFINTGRGRQVDEIGLLRALRECRSRCALLDVTSREPVIPMSEISRQGNIFISPHIAGSQGRECERMFEGVLREFRNVYGA